MLGLVVETLCGCSPLYHSVSLMPIPWNYCGWLSRLAIKCLAANWRRRPWASTVRLPARDCHSARGSASQSAPALAQPTAGCCRQKRGGAVSHAAVVSRVAAVSVNSAVFPKCTKRNSRWTICLFDEQIVLSVHIKTGAAAPVSSQRINDSINQ